MAHEDELNFKIHPAKGGSEVPVSVLTQSLNMLQEMVHLFALKQEGRSMRQRLRLPAEIANKYVLLCKPPEKGSFAVSARVADMSEDTAMLLKIPEVVHEVRDFTEAAVKERADTIVRLMPDSRLRSRALSCLRKLSPPPGSGYLYALSNGTGASIDLDENLPARIEKLLLTPAERQEVQTVTGRLEQISFSERKLTMIYAPKGRWLECTYEDSVEPMLLENRRDLIQVTGRVIMDEENHPKKIVEVEEVQDLDLSPFVLSEIAGTNFVLKPRQQLSLTPSISEDEQLICLDHPAWGLDVFASTRGQLFEELKEQILMLWTEFATEVDEALSKPALQAKHQLLKDWEAV